MSMMWKIFKRLRNYYFLLRCKVSNHNRVAFIGGGISLCSDTNIIADSGNIEIGQNVSINRNVHLTATANGKLMIGNNVSFNRNDIVICRGEITIGNHVAFGPNVVLYDHDHIFNIEGFDSDNYKVGSIKIGNDCWVASNVIILRNTTIGDGCVIGAGCVVQGVIPPHSIVKMSRELVIDSIR